ncbi:elongation factor 1-beta [Candidatus Pacearchaeota archaeon]|jgi:translation elongation factor aEF-1 beta|nr:elongation factor 1-beta [Candidatus Pacearchaeota archaeon]|tara:strand:+ start:257 stop:529 length:273 start_codon:yes stop_codon:yes gene_type:complete
MGTALLTIKMMPESPETNLEEVEAKAKQVIESLEGKSPQFQKEPVAFGIISLSASFSIDESLETDPFEEKLKTIEGVNSAETTDFRRAFG